MNIDELKYMAYATSPTAMKVAAHGRLDMLAAGVYGLDSVTEDEVVPLMALRQKLAKNRTKEAMLNVYDLVEGMGGQPVKLAAYQQFPQGVMPEAWNFVRVEKAAKLFEIADLQMRAGQKKQAAASISAGEKLAERAFDWFKHRAELDPEKTAGVGQVVGDAIDSPATREYAKKVLGTLGLGAAGGAGLAAGAMPIVSSYSDDMMDEARNKALQTAAGTAGVALGANQLNNLLNRYTKESMSSESEGDQTDREKRPGESSPYYVEETEGRRDYSDDKIDKEKDVHPLSKMAFHYLVDLVYDMDEDTRLANKVACVNAIAEFCDLETVMFEKRANVLERMGLTEAKPSENEEFYRQLGATSGILGGATAGNKYLGDAAETLGGNIGALFGNKGRAIGEMVGRGGAIIGSAIGGGNVGAGAGRAVGKLVDYGAEGKTAFDISDPLGNKAREDAAKQEAMEVAGSGVLGMTLGGMLGYDAGGSLSKAHAHDLIDQSMALNDKILSRGRGISNIENALLPHDHRGRHTLKQFIGDILEDGARAKAMREAAPDFLEGGSHYLRKARGLGMLGMLGGLGLGAGAGYGIHQMNKQANAMNPSMYSGGMGGMDTQMGPQYPNGPAGAPMAGPGMMNDQTSMDVDASGDMAGMSGGDAAGK